MIWDIFLCGSEMVGLASWNCAARPMENDGILIENELYKVVKSVWSAPNEIFVYVERVPESV